MNPRHRRLVLPSLLAALVLVVVVVSLVREAKAATPPPAITPLGVIRDAQVTESSGLVISRLNADVAYTVNDSGNDSIVYTIRLSDGALVGRTTVYADWQDVEAVSIDGDGTLWIADVGDNETNRDHVSVYSLPEPGIGDHVRTPDVYDVRYADGPSDVETMLVNPRTGAKYLVSKRADGGRVYRLPKLRRNGEVEARPLRQKVAQFVTDGGITPDGKTAVLRSHGHAHYYDVSDWAGRGDARLPKQKQGESLAVDLDGHSYVVGTEGANSTLFRVQLTLAPTATKAPVATSTGDGSLTWWYVGFGVVVLLGGVAVVRYSR